MKSIKMILIFSLMIVAGYCNASSKLQSRKLLERGVKILKRGEKIPKILKYKGTIKVDGNRETRIPGMRTSASMKSRRFFTPLQGIIECDEHEFAIEQIIHEHMFMHHLFYDLLSMKEASDGLQFVDPETGQIIS